MKLRLVYEAYRINLAHRLRSAVRITTRWSTPCRRTQINAVYARSASDSRSGSSWG